MIANALRLSVYFGEAIAAGPALASDALLACFASHGLATATLLRGIEGFGLNRRVHAERFPDVSTDLPLLAVAVDTRERIHGVLDEVDRVVSQGLVTLETTRLATGRDVARATVPAGPGRAAQLTIACGAGDRAGRQPAYRAAVALLRRCGATGATVLPGVDGLLRGRRGRARLFATNASTPMTIVSVGTPDRLLPALPQLVDLLGDPVVTLEPIARLPHGSAPPEPPPADAESGIWQALGVFVRRSDLAGGRALHSELVRCLRQAGAAGATTILGDWGFSARERPYGDRLGSVTSHRPTYTVCVDRPAKIAEVWPLLDELIAGRGIATSRFVPGYRERSRGRTVRASLRSGGRCGTARCRRLGHRRRRTRPARPPQRHGQRAESHDRRHEPDEGADDGDQREQAQDRPAGQQRGPWRRRPVAQHAAPDDPGGRHVRDQQDGNRGQQQRDAERDADERDERQDRQQRQADRDRDAPSDRGAEALAHRPLGGMERARGQPHEQDADDQRRDGHRQPPSERAHPSPPARSVSPVVADVAADARAGREHRTLVAVAQVAADARRRTEERPVRHGDQVAVDPAGDADRAADRHDVARRVSGDPHAPVEDDDVAGGLTRRQDGAARDHHAVGRGSRTAGCHQERQQCAQQRGGRHADGFGRAHRVTPPALGPP
jgi:PII-like signaling protein